jgi:hypothetical protein
VARVSITTALDIQSGVSPQPSLVSTVPTSSPSLPNSITFYVQYLLHTFSHLPPTFLLHTLSRHSRQYCVCTVVPPTTSRSLFSPTPASHPSTPVLARPRPPSLTDQRPTASPALANSRPSKRSPRATVPARGDTGLPRRPSSAPCRLRWKRWRGTFKGQTNPHPRAWRRIGQWGRYHMCSR